MLSSFLGHNLNPLKQTGGRFFCLTIGAFRISSFQNNCQTEEPSPCLRNASPLLSSYIFHPFSNNSTEIR